MTASPRVIFPLLTEGDEVTDDMIEDLLVELASFFNESGANKCQLSGLPKNMTHDFKLETVFRSLGYRIIFSDCNEDQIIIEKDED